MMLETYCAAKEDWLEITKDLGSGMNYRKKGLQSLLDKILRKQMRRLVLTHKDRLVWVRASICSCEMQGIEIDYPQGDQPTFEEELAQDVLEIITVFQGYMALGLKKA